MIRFELDNHEAHELLLEIKQLIADSHIGPISYKNTHELRKSLRKQLGGLIDDNDKWINYDDIDFLRSELIKYQDLVEKYDGRNPFHQNVPYAFHNLTNLFQQKCSHANKKYESLRGSPYRTLFCQDCKAELSGLEYKPSFLKINNIDLSVFEENKNDKN